MSLVSDPGYLVHSLRLSYLRNVDDPYGSRIISLSPSYTSNPYVLAASLADPNRWPELEYPSSPPISDDEDDKAPGTSQPGPATGIRHHQTIMGNRSGALGMRITGRRASTSRRASQVANKHSLAQPDPDTPLPRINPITTADADSARPQEPDVSRSSHKDDLDPPPKEVQFIPKFKGAAEMEARRKLRMLARRGQTSVNPKHASDTNKYLNPEVSSSDDADGSLEDDDNDDDFDLVDRGDEMDEGDEFDPDFAATRTPGAGFDSASDLASILSGPASAVSASNPLNSSSYVPARSRLSPVTEARGTDDSESRDDHSAADHDESIVAHFEMVNPPPPPPPPDHRTTPFIVRPEGRKRGLSLSLPILDLPPSDIVFSRSAVFPALSKVSALSTMLASTGGSANPFNELYGAISGRGESASMDVKVFFPHAREPKGKVMTLNVRRDATIEEVIGFAMWSYWEEGWLPKLIESVSENDPKLSGIGWIMRIAEDDGEVDEDFPPPDRTGKVTKFNFDAFAILAATPLQIQQNEQLESKIQRRPSRIMAAPKKADALPAPSLVPPSVPGAGTSSLFGTTPVLSSSLGPSSSHGPPIFLRVRVADTADAVHISTTIPVSAGMYLQEALEVVCRKRKLANPQDYALILNDLNLLIYLDRTVASLEGKRELTLVKRSMLPQMGIEPESRAMRTTDPNASIFKRISDVPEMHQGGGTDYTAAYKRYTIYRKMPMLARQERTLAIDGVYVHIMPSANKAKAVFDSGKTLSFHVKSVLVCQQSQKTSTLFKVVVQRDSRNKRYDFEADTAKLAAEIVQAIKTLKTSLERSSTVHRSRRSRHGG
ncbi:stress-activated map kinase interacting protein 1-domain-containing protein [Boletus edulis BED1]|uniref:Stress-activated map kinase interacting protein 1-domain-containing protein n=1 Tax=Boletus edulis BED1 TaxID=1328754 RepID=A0AAD4GGJ5_BOLED|nr:stress-activated map kinase interacting protein 1-domain-containing protein [Boletus edulis BED1]